MQASQQRSAVFRCRDTADALRDAVTIIRAALARDPFFERSRLQALAPFAPPDVDNAIARLCADGDAVAPDRLIAQM